MSEETRNPQDEAEDERRPSHLTDDEPEVEGHIKRGRNETAGDENERRPSHLTDGEEGFRRD